MYIPVIKNRSIEISVIRELVNIGLSEKTIPMFEIIQEKTRSNSSKNYIEELKDIFNQKTKNFFLDIPKINVTASTSEQIKTFMTKVNRQKDYAYEEMLKCKNIEGIIPVLSFGVKVIVESDEVIEDLIRLQKKFLKVAIRLTPVQCNKMAKISMLPLRKEDFFILDIDDKGHTNPAFKKLYREIQEFKNKIGFLSFLINANRPSNFYNKNIIDGEPIEEIDNSLLEMYHLSSYKFDGFGDYACITNALPGTGGAISPAGIYYSKDGNFFVGYKGRAPSLSEFVDYIAPTIIDSIYWKEYTEEHHDICPGCKKIKAIKEGGSGRSQGLWKGITMSHYIYTVDKIMNSFEI